MFLNGGRNLQLLLLSLQMDLYSPLDFLISK